MSGWFKKFRASAAHSPIGDQRTCALCNAPLDKPETEQNNAGPDLPRYDLCPQCEGQLFAQWGVPFQEYIDGLQAPVVITDDNIVLKAANRAACNLLNREAGQMTGLPSGLVFECEHASKPEGCGRTVHCSGCVIRNTVMDCYLSGRPHLRIPATLERGEPGETTTERLLISTLRRDNVVLLKIELASADTQ